MTLEDFFTLTEMKDGLAVPARVKDLVNVMHREKDSIVKSVGDMTRQWSTVASTIIATEDKDCLELFIQLDGLCFIDRWLNDAQRLSVDVNENFVEESITVLLRALEKLQVGYERSSSSGILLTVKNLLNHGSSRVQDGAKALFDQWKRNGDIDDTAKDVQNGDAGGEDVILERSGAATSLPEEEKKYEPDTNEGMPVVSAEDVEKERTDDKEVKEDNDTRFDYTDVENSSKEESVVVADSVEKENDSFTPMVIDEVIEERSNAPIPNDCADDTKQEMPMRTVANELGAMEIVSTGQLQTKVDSSAEDDLPDSGTGNVLPMEIDIGKDESKAPDNGNATFPNEVNGEVDEQEEGDDDSSEENKELTINLNLLKPAIICKVPNSINDEKKSDIELDYSIVDALEVARQVAIEATREMEDHREPSCSSSSEKKKKKSIDCSSMKDEEPSSSRRSSSSRETLNPKTENSSQLTVSSQEIDLDRELEANSGKGLIGLDLNMDICSEDVDHPEKPIPTHISQVSASRAAAVSELASSPLQQQPEEGWKGSATTSAFRRVLEGGVDKTSTTPPPPGKLKSQLLDFDLNVAEDEEEEENDKGPTNSRPILDLNTISDDSDSVPDHNHSSLKNIDLNLIEELEPNSDHRHHHHHNLQQTKPFNQSISLMGIRMEVGKRESMMTQQQPPKDHHHPHINPPRIGGDSFFSFAPTVQYGQMTYNGGNTVGPSSSPFSLPPYMGGGPPVVPPPQFFMMGPTGGHYGAGSSSSSSNHNRILDLNMTMNMNLNMNMNMNMGTTNDGGNRDGVGFRQFLSMGGGGGGGQNSLQPSSSSGYGIGKRKESEGGWEGYPHNNLKRQPPPWK